VVSSNTRPIVNQTDNEKVFSIFSVLGIAYGQGTSISIFKCIKDIVASNDDITTTGTRGNMPVTASYKPSLIQQAVLQTNLIPNLAMVQGKGLSGSFCDTPI
jgi:hypothetical protein